MKERLESLIGNWYGQLDDIYVELAKIGVDFDYATSEYIIAWYLDKEEDEMVEVKIRLGGTPSTITIEDIEESYRG